MAAVSNPIYGNLVMFGCVYLSPEIPLSVHNAAAAVFKHYWQSGTPTAITVSSTSNDPFSHQRKKQSHLLLHSYTVPAQ